MKEMSKFVEIYLKLFTTQSGKLKVAGKSSIYSKLKNS